MPTSLTDTDTLFQQNGFQINQGRIRQLLNVVASFRTRRNKNIHVYKVLIRYRLEGNASLSKVQEHKREKYFKP